MLNTYIEMVWKNLKNRKVRSYLTIIGIVIGITTMITILLLGEGLQRGMTDQFDKFGTRRIFIGPKSASGFGPPSGSSALTESDVDVLKSMPSVEYVTPVYMDMAKVEFKRERKNINILSYEAEDIKQMAEDIDINLIEGKWFEDKDTYGVVIGYSLAKEEVFENNIRLRNGLKIEDKKFKVIGIKEKEGDANSDTTISMLIDSLRDIKDRPKAITAISAMVKKGEDMELVAKKIEDKLERRRGDENFQVTSPVKIKEQTGSILAVVRIVFLSIAFISLLVGGIGIMNSMFTSVLERTREIGVMKAIGARNSVIQILFLLEAGGVGMIGGVIGTAIGILLTYGIAKGITASGFVEILIEIKPSVILLGILFSFIVGMISGLIPAIKAARLQPVEALRYE